MEVVARVVSQKGNCEAGMREGDRFIIGQKTPAGMCAWAYHTLFPFAQTLIFGGSFPWESDPDRAQAACLDPDGAVP